MPQLYERLHKKPQNAKDVATWRCELSSLHGKIHEKITDYKLCRVCGVEAGPRLWKDVRQTAAEWNTQAVQLLWEATVETVSTHGTGWSAWREEGTEPPSTALSLPPKLQLEAVPLDQVAELSDGAYAWGRYKTERGLRDKNAGWAVLNQQWQQDRKVRIDLLLEAQQRPAKNPQNLPGLRRSPFIASQDAPGPSRAPPSIPHELPRGQKASPKAKRQQTRLSERPRRMRGTILLPRKHGVLE